MFSNHHLFKLFAAIAVAASIAVTGARSATAGTPYNPTAYVPGGASAKVARAIQSASKTQSFHLITDTLGGNGYAKVVVHFKQESVRMIPDILGGNGLPLRLLPLRTLAGRMLVD